MILDGNLDAEQTSLSFHNAILGLANYGDFGAWGAEHAKTAIHVLQIAVSLINLFPFYKTSRYFIQATLHNHLVSVSPLFGRLETSTPISLKPPT